MRFTSISSNNFRNIFSSSINLDNENIILKGINGQGKTNFLEEIYILCYGTSFRTSILKDCIKKGKTFFSIRGNYINDNNERGTISFSLNGKDKKIILDNKEIRDRKELIYNFPCIVFSYEDMAFVTGEAEDKRKFFDQMISLFSMEYLDKLREYRVLIMQRNAALKTQDISIFSLYDFRIAERGLYLMREREKIVNEFNQFFTPLYKEITNTEDELKVEYVPSWKDIKTEEEVVEILGENTERDLKFGSTYSGPHRDKFVITKDNDNFSSIGSTGQNRLCSVIFRIVEGKYFTKKTGKKPILLLDDVLLELDRNKREKVLNNLPPYSQAFYTFIKDEKYGKKKNNSLFYTIKEGEVL